MEAIMRAYPDAENTYPNDHHTHPDDVPRDLPVYSVVRNPYTHLVSWWNNTWGGDPTTFQKFLDEYGNEQFFPKHGWPSGHRLNMYADTADRWFLFEKGVENILDEMEVPFDHVDLVGVSQKRPYLYNHGKFVPQVERDFAKDLELYRRVAREQSYYHGWVE
jgi:hypothetical protein